MRSLCVLFTLCCIVLVSVVQQADARRFRFRSSGRSFSSRPSSPRVIPVRVRRNNSQQNQARAAGAGAAAGAAGSQVAGDVSAPAGSGGTTTADQLNVPTQMIDSGGSSSTQVAGAMELGPERSGSRLPNTGGEPWLMLLAGGTLTLAAWTLRRRVA